MRIGIDIRNIGKKRTGDEAVFFNLVKNLAEIDSANEYYLLTDITTTTILRNMVVVPLGIENKKNFRVVSLDCPNKFVWNAWTLPWHLRQNPVDVYHTQYITPFFVPKKIKIITTIHDISFNFYPQHIHWKDLFFLKMLIPRSLKRADKIIAVSNFTRDEIVSFYKINPSKIEVVHNAAGDNFRKNDYAALEPEKIRKKYNLPEKYILYLGTMQPRKNIPALIEAFSRIRDRLPEYKLVLAGKKGHNWDRKIDELMARPGIAKNIIFTGYIEENEKPAVFKMADLFVTASFYEGFGIPILEALSQETPVLASDIKPHREAGAESVLYFNSSDIDDLEKKMYNALIGSGAKSAGRTKLINRPVFFSWKKSAEKLLAAYNQLNIWKQQK